MTLDQFLDVLEAIGGEWFVSPEGYLRQFVQDRFQSEGEHQWDWVVSAVARKAGRNYHILDWRKAGAFLKLTESDLLALKGADQRHPDHMALRLVIERRLGLHEIEQQAVAISEQGAKLKAATEDLKADWQKEPGKEEQIWSDYLKKQAKGDV